MTPPVNALTWAGAALPIILLLYLLVVQRWSAVQAAAAGALAALLVAFFIYKAPLSVIGAEIGKGVWNSVSIMAVIFPAILIYELSREVGGFSAIQRDLTRLIPDKLLQVLAIGWCFTSFLQGPSGFGAPIAVTAPLLIGIGVKPFWAVVVPLMAHAWGNTFGTLGLGWESLVQQTSLGANADAYWRAALWTGILTGILCVLAGAIICWMYRGMAGLRRGWPALLILGAIQAGGQLALTQITPTLCAVIPTTLAFGASFLLARMPRYATAEAGALSPMFAEGGQKAAAPGNLTMHEALLPYYILVGISVFALLTPPVTSLLSAWKMSFSFPATVTGHGFANKAYAEYGTVSWFTHSGFFLLLATLVSMLYFASKGLVKQGGAGRIIVYTLYKSVPACVSVVLLLVMSKIMSGSGQVDVLASGTAAATGGFYALLAPAVGTLGSFMTSSNVSSNILLGQFQESMAVITQRDVAVSLAAQTSGASIGTMFSPSKVLLGTTTAGIVGQEGPIIRKMIGVAGLAAAVMGVITFIWS